MPQIGWAGKAGRGGAGEAGFIYHLLTIFFFLDRVAVHMFSPHVPVHQFFQLVSPLLLYVA